MDPQSQKRYLAFIDSRQTQQRLNPIQKNKRGPFNRFYALGIILGILIILPATFTLLRQNTYQDGRIASTDKQTASLDVNTELTLMMGSTAPQSQTNPDVIKRAQRNLKLKKEAQKLKINLKSSQQTASSKDVTQNYALDMLTLEREVEKKVITSRTADYVTTFVMPTGNYKEKEAQVKSNLEFIRQELRAGKSITLAYENLVKKLGQDPKYTVAKNAYITPNSGYSSGFITALFKTKSGDITSVIQSNGTDFMIAKVTGAVNTKFNSLSSWEAANLK